MNKELLEIYSDYLINSFSYTTATGLSEMLEGAISILPHELERNLTEQARGWWGLEG